MRDGDGAAVVEVAGDDLATTRAAICLDWITDRAKDMVIAILDLNGVR
jgi:hypothetical protein